MRRRSADPHVVELRLHGIVLARPLVKALASSLVGAAA